MAFMLPNRQCQNTDDMLHLVSGINLLLLSIKLIPIYLWLAFSCSYGMFFLCWFFTVTIHKSLTLEIYLIDSLLTSRLTPRTLWLDCYFWATRFLFLVLFVTFSVFLVPCGKVRWLPVSFRVQDNIVYHIVFYIVTANSIAFAEESHGACHWL